MAVYIPAAADEPYALITREMLWNAANGPPACFCCTQAIDFTAALPYWRGTSGIVILFHPACAEKIGATLLGDARECRLAVAATPLWRDRARTLVRAVLRGRGVADRREEVTP